MACSAMRYPLLRNPAVRNYAVAAAAQCSPVTAADIKTLPNKVTVAAIDNQSPIAQVSIIFKAGSRNETYDTQGISHILRVSAGLTTKESSGFRITRTLQQLGAELTTNGDREHISYTLRVIRDNLKPALQFLDHVATQQVFKPWEISDETPRLRFEASNIPEHVRIVELLYKAAYRNGLGYSLYCPKRQIDKISSESLKYFVSTLFTAPRCAVVGSGLSLAEVEQFACSLKLPETDCTSPASKYIGGEIRKERNSELTTVGLAVEGTGLSKLKEAIAFAVLQKAAGDGPSIKRGACNSSLNKALASASQGQFGAVGFNASHSDSGLFGLILRAPAENAGALTKAAVGWLRSPSISDSDVARGKASLKLAILAEGDSQIRLHESIGNQALFSGNVITPETLASEVDKISASDVKNAASKVSKGKLTIASIGNLSKIPPLDQL